MVAPVGACGAATEGDAEAGVDQATATVANTSADTIIKAFNEERQFPNVVQIWATDDIIAALAGPFEAYASFADIPREMRAAPDATTWAGVQLWQWWSSPDVDRHDNRDISIQCLTTIWTVLHAACRTAEADSLPELEPELWLLIFTFLKNDRPFAPRSPRLTLSRFRALRRGERTTSPCGLQ